MGRGRTGTLISALILKNLIGQGKITLENFDQKFIDLILKLRTERSKYFVHADTQFDLLFQYGQNLLEKV